MAPVNVANASARKPRERKARHRRVGRHAGRQPEDTDRNAHQGLRVLEGRDRPFRAKRGETPQDPIVHDRDRERGHDRKRAKKIPPKIGVAETQNRPPADSRPQAAEEREAERPEDASCQNAPGEAERPGLAAAQKPPDDDRGRVDEGGEGGEEVAVARLEGGGEQSAENMEELRGEEDPGEKRQGCRRFRVESRGDDPQQRGDGPPERGEENGEEHDEEVGDLAERLPSPVFVLAREVRGEDRDEDDGQRAPGEKVVEEIGEDEGGPEDIRLAAASEHPAHDHLPHEPHDAGEKDRGPPDEGRDGDGPGHRESSPRKSTCGGRRAMRAGFGASELSVTGQTVDADLALPVALQAVVHTHHLPGETRRGRPFGLPRMASFALERS